jgi:hypothetical protein
MKIKRGRRFLNVVFAVGVLSHGTACDTGAEAPGKTTTQLACESISAAAPTQVTLEAFTGGAGPIMKAQATPYAVTLEPSVAPKYWSGHGQWAIEKEGTYAIYVSPLSTFVLRDADKALQKFSHILGTPSSCDKIDQYGFVHLAPGTYSIELGPVPVSSLKMLLIPVAADDNL